MLEEEFVLPPLTCRSPSHLAACHLQKYKQASALVLPMWAIADSKISQLSLRP
jgi:hypothetical protein